MESRVAGVGVLLHRAPDQNDATVHYALVADRPQDGGPQTSCLGGNDQDGDSTQRWSASRLPHSFLPGAPAVWDRSLAPLTLGS